MVQGDIELRQRGSSGDLGYLRVELEDDASASAGAKAPQPHQSQSAYALTVQSFTHLAEQALLVYTKSCSFRQIVACAICVLLGLYLGMSMRGTGEALQKMCLNKVVQDVIHFV